MGRNNQYQIENKLDGYNEIQIPDWDNAKKLTVTNSDFVISDFGLIVGSFYSNQNRTYLVVNGVNVSCAGNINNSFGWDGQVQLEVRQGDIIKFSSTQYATVNIWFVPYKQY